MLARLLPQQGKAVIGALVALPILIELVLQLGDRGVIDIPRFRNTVYEFGGFWPGLLDTWRPNYPLQSWMMFLTYGVLHVSLTHLVLNMITLVALAGPVIDRVGGGRFLILYAAALLGGGLGFALLSDTYRPMVGASGALFGLAGALLAWDYVDRFSLQERLWPVARTVLLLALLNVALYFAMDQLLAWEAHLGGFVAGWITALILDPRGHVE